MSLMLIEHRIFPFLCCFLRQHARDRPAFVRVLIPAEQQVCSCFIVELVSLLIYRIQPIKAWSRLLTYCYCYSYSFAVTQLLMTVARSGPTSCDLVPSASITIPQWDIRS